MTLYNYLKMCDGDFELTITDKDYDIEFYMYSNYLNDDGLWNKAMTELSKKVYVEKILDKGRIVVNLNETVNASIDNFKKKDLFHNYDIDSIMEDMDKILCGYVSEKWMMDFAKCLVKICY